MRQPTLLLACLALACLTAAPGAAADANPAPAADAPRFLLLIHGSEAPPAEREAVVEAYRQWARRLAAEGRLVEADELAEEAVLLSAGENEGEMRRASRTPSAGGYFLVAAADLEAALAIARDCPALRHGGAVEVVPIRHD
jgi:hypothetical protein